MRSHAGGHYASMDETIAMLALSTAQADVGLQHLFVFRPGDPLGNHANVFVTWGALYAATQATFGQPTIEVDSSIAPANVPAGAYNFSDGLMLIAQSFDSTLTFQTGATVTTPSLFVQSLILNSTSTAPVFNLSNAEEIVFYNAAIQNFFPSPAPMFSIPAGSSAVFLSQNSAIGEGTGAVITIGAGGETSPIVAISNTSILAHAIAGAGTANVVIDSSSTVFSPQPVATYSPVLAGLNLLQEVLAATQGPAVTISQNSVGTITRQRAGNMRVTAQASFTQIGAGSGNVTMQLTRDGVPIVGAPDAKDTTAAESQLSITFYDTISDSNPHHYGWTATVSSGTLTANAGDSSISVQEL